MKLGRRMDMFSYQMFFNMSSDFSENNSWILMNLKISGVLRGLIFVKNPDPVNINVSS